MGVILDANVVVVGAGAAGLSAAAALKQNGIDATVLEQDARIGGTWSRRYDRLHLHTVRGFSGLAHFGIPRRYPAYLSRDQFVSYLREYADHFGLKIVNRCEVEKISRDPQSNEWKIVTGTGDTWRCNAVVIASGQYRIPIKPEWPGAEIFGGELSHSASYSNPTPFIGKRVLVVGAGNSGAEIATDIAENGGKFVALSIRTPPAIVPRDPFGMPVQRTGIMLGFLPARIADRIGRLTARLVLGDLTAYKIPTPAWGPFSARRIPLISCGFEIETEMTIQMLHRRRRIVAVVAVSAAVPVLAVLAVSAVVEAAVSRASASVFHPTPQPPPRRQSSRQIFAANSRSAKARAEGAPSAASAALVKMRAIG